MKEVTLVVKVMVEDSTPESDMLDQTISEIFDCGIDNYVPDDSVKDDILDNIISMDVK